MKRIASFFMALTLVMLSVMTASAASTYTSSESEPNNTIATATIIYDNDTVTGKISSTSDVDYYKIKFSNNGTANFWLGNIPSGKDFDLYLCNSAGTTLASSTTATGNQEIITQYSVTAGVWYYIKVVGYNGSYDASHSYTLRVRNYLLEHAYGGVLVNSTTNRGISATIKVPSSLPVIYGNNTSVWVSTGLDSNSEWVQAGARYRKDYTSFEPYTEHYANGIYQTTNYGTQASGTQKTYKVEYLESDGKWHAYIGGVEKVSSTLSEVKNLQAQGEVHKRNLQMGPFYFSNVKIKNSSNTWNNNTVSPTAKAPYSVSGSATSFTVSGPTN